MARSLDRFTLLRARAAELVRRARAEGDDDLLKKAETAALEVEVAALEAEVGSRTDERAREERAPPDADHDAAWRQAFLRGSLIVLGQLVLLVVAFADVDSPSASGGLGHFAGIAVVALSILALRPLVRVARARGGRLALLLGGAVGLPSGILIAAFILPTLATAGSFLYIGPIFAYVAAIAYVAAPWTLLAGIVAFVKRRRHGRGAGRGWLAPPLMALLILHGIVGAWFAIASSLMASTARTAYARNTPGVEVTLLVAATLLAWALKRARG